MNETLQLPTGADYSASPSDENQLVHSLARYFTLLTINTLQSKWVKRAPESDNFPLPAPRKQDAGVIVSSDATVELEDEFADLVHEWRSETGFHSSLSKKFMHRAYQRIIAMGEPALPLILRELRDRPGHWFYALRLIAGEKGKGVSAGMDDFDDARSAWLEWGYKNNYL
jgi:hypothetical protein